MACPAGCANGNGVDGTDTAQINLIYAKGVAGAESAAHIVRAADIVQHQHKAALLPMAVLLCRQSAQFYIEKFSVFHVAKVKVFS